MKKTLSIPVILCLIVFILTPILTLQAENSDIVFSEAELAQINEALQDDTKDLPISEMFRVYVSPGDLSVSQGLDETWMNILLMGTDTGDIKLNYGRSDAMLVLSIHKETGAMKLTSLVRDMYVDIPGTAMQNRINTANAFGGPMLAMKTVNEVLELNITRYCSINFRGFEEVVDYLGGVTLALSGGEAASVDALRTREPQVLNGAQALKYVRIRSLDNNFGRNERQRKFLTSLLDQVKQSSFDQIMDATTAALKTIATNMTIGEIISLIPPVLRNADSLETLSLPPEGAYNFATSEAGASVVTFDLEQVRDAFHGFVYSGTY